MPGRILVPSGDHASVASPLLARVVTASDLGVVTVSERRHDCCARATIGTGSGRDPKMNFPQYATGGDNYGSIGGLFTPNSAPSGSNVPLLGSLLNFFDQPYSGGSLDEVGWAVNPYAFPSCDATLRAFTDNAQGVFQCFSAYPLNWGTWYFFGTLAVGGGQWANFIFWDTNGDGNPDTWVTLDVRTQMPNLSSGLDPGSEATVGVGPYTSAVGALRQLRVPAGGAYETVGPRDSTNACTAQPTGRSCAYTINNTPLATILLSEHNAFWVGRP